MCTSDAPASKASCVDSICSDGVTGTAGLSALRGTAPVMATVMMTGVLISIAPPARRGAYGRSPSLARYSNFGTSIRVLMPERYNQWSALPSGPPIAGVRIAVDLHFQKTIRVRRFQRRSTLLRPDRRHAPRWSSVPLVDADDDGDDDADPRRSRSSWLPLHQHSR